MNRFLAKLPAIRFAVGSTVLDAEAYGAPDRVVALLECPGRRIELVGHADSQGPGAMNRYIETGRKEHRYGEVGR